jgi:hypothetical protein
MLTYREWLYNFYVNFLTNNPGTDWPARTTMEALYDVYLISQEVV